MKVKEKEKEKERYKKSERRESVSESRIYETIVDRKQFFFY